ncbi:FAD-dependent oxidoreductase [Tropicimonas aquimaris]|uniref:FAD-dependent oxidoreductase n=1 Tax=Tropicimonas aquimaris TaxID=914152 RepID=A0ABW3ITT9_9RHOB
MRDEQTDVLVIGGGTAGFGAAVAAGRQGLRVTLLEATTKIGGVMAFCPGMPWGGGYPADRIIGGLIEELTNRLASMQPPAAEKRLCALENFGPEIVYDHDIATLTMFDMLEEAGVRVRLGAIALEPHMEGRRIASIACCDRNGPFTVDAKIVIDCSGDGDISAKAGVPYMLGDASGNMMAVTISFQMVGVEWARAFADPDPYFQKQAARGIADGRLHPDLAKLYLMRGFHDGTVFCNSVHLRGVDGTDPLAVSAATQEGRRRCLHLAQFLRSDVPGFERAHMSMLSPTSGVRETRKLQGIYRLKGEDIARATKFPDGVVACDNPIDDVMRAGAAMTHDAATAAGEYYTIPFSALVPAGIVNLMFAGRILSADPVAFASVRGMPQCMAMGQATGTAAALTIRNRVHVQNVSHDDLVRSLADQGVNRLRTMSSH